MTLVSRYVRRLTAGFLATLLACCLGGCPANPGPTSSTTPQLTQATVGGSLMQSQSGTVTISVTATDPSGKIVSVTADLTQIGGQQARALQQGLDNVWTWTGNVQPQQSGTQKITLTATNDTGMTASVQVSVDVAVPGTAPEITNLAAGGPLALNEANTITITVSVTDEDDGVKKVTGDLSQIGGPANAELQLGSGDVWSFQGTITPKVEGTRTVTIKAVDGVGTIGEATTTFTVSRTITISGAPVTLDVDGLAVDHKVTPGAGLTVNGVTRVQVTPAKQVTSGQVTLDITAGGSKVNIWKNANKTDALTLPQTWTLPGGLQDLYVEGAQLSDNPQDIQLTVSYNNPDMIVNADSMTDKLDLTVLDIQKNPLGGNTGLAGLTIGKVYVPTQYGGDLTVSGANVQLIYTDGSDLNSTTASEVFQGTLDGSIVAQGNPATWSVPAGQHGWCYIRLAQDSAGTISSDFAEGGQASYRPWNGWWWPFLPTSGPTLYDAGGPFDKYDQVYGTAARNWEATNQAYGEYWFGHCWGWSIAAILIPEPQATTKSGVDFTSDDVKGLYTELCDCNPYFDSSLSITFMPTGPVTSASGEVIDGFCDDFYRIMRTCIRDEGVPLQSDMRAIDTPPNRANEKWNQSIYRYAADFSEAGAGDEHIVQIFLQTWSNFGPYPPPTDDSASRYEEFVIQLEFDSQGQLVAQSSNQNWISCSHYPPSNLYRLTGSPYTPSNPYITKPQIDGLYTP